MGALHRELSKVLEISRRILRRMRNVFKQKFVEKIKRHILCSVTFLP